MSGGGGKEALVRVPISKLPILLYIYSVLKIIWIRTVDFILLLFIIVIQYI